MSQSSAAVSTQSMMGSSVNAENSTPDDSEQAQQVELVEVKRRKLTSTVWEHYTREAVGGNGNITAICNYCKRKFDGSSKSGTSHLRNHTKTCPLRTSSDIRQAFIGKCSDDIGKSGDDVDPKMTIHKFDPAVERKLFAKMIAKHDLPFLMSQYEHFRAWVSYCMPSYKHRSRTTVKSDLMDLYVEEKSLVYKDLGNLTSRITLTTDGWTADHQNRGYFCITSHYIDSNWELQKRLLAFHIVQYPHNGLRLSEWLKNRILEWNIDKNLFAVVVDNATQNSGMLDGIMKWLNDKNALLHNGDMFHIRCSAHIMNLIVKNGLDVIRGLIEKIRDSVKYINGSVARDEKFSLALSQTRLNPKRRVSLECDTRWNSTYDMLIKALDLQEAFKRLVELDSDYIFLPSKEEWEMGAKVCRHLKIFKDATDALSGSKYPTAPLYFTYVCHIRVALMAWNKSDDENIRRMAFLMQAKFDKYWEECNMVLTIASILDPRYKMTLIQAAFSNIYGDYADIYTSKVRSFWTDLFAEYGNTSLASDVCESSSSHIENLVIVDDPMPMNPIISTFKALVAETKATTLPRKSEIELYLEEGLLQHDEQDNAFDVLHWWKHNGMRFPTLSKMARDILPIPCTSVPSESTFSQARRVVDDTRASLNSETVEALLCVKDW